MKRARKLSAELRQVLDEAWEVELAAYCQSLYDRLRNGEDPIVIKREFNAIRRIHDSARRRNDKREVSAG